MSCNYLDGAKGIGSLDLWGTLAILTNDSVNDKLLFCLRLIDPNPITSAAISASYNDLFVLILCITRGIAKLKGFDAIPVTIIDSILVY